MCQPSKCKVYTIVIFKLTWLTKLIKSQLIQFSRMDYPLLFTVIGISNGYRAV